MKVELSSIAKTYGIEKIKCLHEKDLGENLIACVIEEITNKKGFYSKIIYPAIVFKRDVKLNVFHYINRNIKINQDLLPLEQHMLYKAYYDVSFGGYSTIIQLWGYESTLIPKKKKWKPLEMERNTRNFLNTAIKYAKAINLYLQKKEG